MVVAALTGDDRLVPVTDKLSNAGMLARLFLSNGLPVWSMRADSLVDLLVNDMAQVTAATRLIQQDGRLFYDADGSGTKSAPVEVARLVGLSDTAIELTLGDFVFV